MAFIYKTLVFKVIVIRITTTGHNVTPYMAAGDFLTILIMPDAPLRTWVNSPLARVARFVLGGNARVAMVIGRTVHLSGATRAEFLAEPEWVAHERVHLRQYREQGLLPFLYRYLLESARVGYYANKYEEEARDEARRVVQAQEPGQA